MSYPIEQKEENRVSRFLTLLKENIPHGCLTLITIIILSYCFFAGSIDEKNFSYFLVTKKSFLYPFSFLSYAFLHLNPSHLGWNMIQLLIVGSGLEHFLKKRYNNRIGTFLFFYYFLISALVGGFLYYLLVLSDKWSFLPSELANPDCIVSLLGSSIAIAGLGTLFLTLNLLYKIEIHSRDEILFNKFFIFYNILYIVVELWVVSRREYLYYLKIVKIMRFCLDDNSRTDFLPRVINLLDDESLSRNAIKISHVGHVLGYFTGLIFLPIVNVVITHFLPNLLSGIILNKIEEKEILSLEEKINSQDMEFL